MTLKESKKVRKLLGNKFHLCEKGDNEWLLFRRYENGDKIYFSEDNKAIMTSETYTYADLLEFAKKHKKIDVSKTITSGSVFYAWIWFFINLINLFFIHSDILTIITITTVYTVIFVDVVNHIIYMKNSKVDLLELEENFKDIYRGK